MFQTINNFFNNKKNNKIIDELSTKYLGKINALENNFKSLSKGEMIEKLNSIREKSTSNENKDIDDEDICIACAITREVSNRTIGLRHYDIQIVGGLSLYFGFIAEMKTGEGKTLVATIPIILNFLKNKKTQ